MPTDVVMPQMGESITEGTLTKWLKQPGDTVKRDEPLFEISTDKVDAEIPSPAEGVLKEVKAKEGDTVAINTVVAVIDAAGSSNGASNGAAPQASAATQSAPAAPPAQVGSQTAPGATPSTDVPMPQMGESITEGTITKWLKKVGDTVQRDEPLFEISTDKVDAEIPSPAEGVLTEIKAQEGQTVAINTVVAVIGGAASAGSVAPAGTGQGDGVASSASQPGAPGGVAAPSGGNAGGPATEVPMPQMGESITEGTITKWLKKVGDTVQRDEPLFEISTDKVDAEIPSPAAGTLTEIRAQEGQTVQINTVVAVIGGAGVGAPVQNKQPMPTATPDTQAQRAGAAIQQQVADGKGPRSSPLVRKIASENGVDLRSAGIAGTGFEGRITKNDIVGYLNSGGKAAAGASSPMLGNSGQQQGSGTPSVPGTPSHSVAQVSSGTAQPVTSARQEASTAQSAPATTAPKQAAVESAPVLGEVVPMSKMRSIIAKRMVESKQTSAHVHTVFKVDMTRIVKLREKEKNKYEQRNGVKLTFMPFITRAAIVALRKHPIVNAAVEGQNIRYNKNINIGIAVALDWGLIVPVLKQTEEKNFLGIARGIVDIADRARNKKLAPDEVAGGTFTLTNSGIFGEQFGTPVINQPQVAILGIGGLNKEALVVQDKDGGDVIAVRSVQRFTLGFDHRIIDGSDAGKFMTDFKNVLENWNEDIG
ncbi:2-oxo acid dehydrogenase subunit E2 [Terriglobus aquaticus]|uniref:Dihydrolipoamide acetyltransferase component of pyruvate dehydrogenase complex n=1 Tax=Terriglobus aquaticus TaxID=940139 RepID=A0ABW9KH44_9BACT|nr:2-oxo acid dehydrogenase subunit E2 [Terriglobus aquaticus]